MWLRFTGWFDFSPPERRGLVTISYRAGTVAFVRRCCADLAISTGRDVAASAPARPDFGSPCDIRAAPAIVIRPGVAVLDRINTDDARRAALEAAARHRTDEIVRTKPGKALRANAPVGDAGLMSVPMAFESLISAVRKITV